MWFALESGSPWSWLGHAQNIETSYNELGNELGNADLSEQP